MRVRLAEFLGSLSLAGDLVNGFAEGKVLRTALLSVDLARLAGVPDEVARWTYYMALVRFLGCTAFAHEEASLYGAGDDISVRNTMAFADATNPDGTLQRIAVGVAPGAPAAAREAAIGRLLGDGRAAVDHARAQCDTLLHLARSFGLAREIAEGLSVLDERWDGLGVPSGLAGEAIPRAARLHAAADIFELALTRSSVEGAADEMRLRAGKHLDPRLAALAAEHVRDLARAADSPDLWELFLAAEPAPVIEAEDALVDDICAAMGRIVDLKSVFWLGHSQRVAETAVSLATRLGLDPSLLPDIRRAGWLHDIGRVGLPNRIWDKPGPLSRLEREQVEATPAVTERVLRRVTALRPLGQLACSAFERLDGSGFHRRLNAAALPPAMRILAVADVMHALGEARPYRAGLDSAEAARVLRDEARAGRLDRGVVEALLDGPSAGQSAPALAVLSEREAEVLVWLARGKTNPEIGILLGISPKTVQHHVAHVYDKIGVSSRAGAALFAMEKGLLAAQR